MKAQVDDRLERSGRPDYWPIPLKSICAKAPILSVLWGNSVAIITTPGDRNKYISREEKLETLITDIQGQTSSCRIITDGTSVMGKGRWLPVNNAWSLVERQIVSPA